MPESQYPKKFLIPKNWIVNALFIMALIALYYALAQKTVTEPVFEIPYSEFKQLLNDIPKFEQLKKWIRSKTPFQYRTSLA